MIELSKDSQDRIRKGVISSFTQNLVAIWKYLMEKRVFIEIIDVDSCLQLLLQDEIATIREKTAELVQKVYNQKGDYGADYILHQQMNYLYRLMQQQEDNQVIRELISKLIVKVSKGEQIQYKKQNHNEKRIFALDKPNKYMDEQIVKALAFRMLNNIIVSNPMMQQINLITIESNELENYKNFAMRDEYAYELVVNKVYSEMLSESITKPSLLSLEEIQQRLNAGIHSYM